MGNFFRTYRTPIFTYLLFVFTSFLMTACDVDQPGFLELQRFSELSPQVQEEPTPEVNPAAIGGQPATFDMTQDKYPENMDVKILCEDARRDACGLLVTLHANRDDVEVDLRLHGDDGVQFQPNLDVLPNLDVIPQNGYESTIARVRLLKGETRHILFPYLPTALDLPGAYRVIVLATEVDTNNLYSYRRENAYIILNEIGEFHLLPSEIEFNGNFRSQFTEGLLDMAYWIQFKGEERPYRGNLWVRVDSAVDGYQPRIEITGGDAVTFLNDGLWKPEVSNAGMTASRNFPVMNAGGSRVAVFPFELDRNGRLLDGEYAFLVKQIESDIVNSETMPIVVQLFSDPQYPNEHWLGAHTIMPAIATATSNATAIASNVNNILLEQVGLGGKYKNLDENTANEVCSDLAKYPLPTNDLPEPRWTRYIANYNGTLCQAYLDFVAGSVAITWPDFERLVVEHNKQNLNSSSGKLEDHRVYILPQTDQ